MLIPEGHPVDVASYRYTLNMQVSSGTKNNSSQTKAILHHRNGKVVQWGSLAVTAPGTIHIKVRRESDWQTKPDLVGKSHRTTVVGPTMHALRVCSQATMSCESEEIGNLIEEAADLARQINSEEDSDDIQELLIPAIRS
ncbi:hypothetical protein TNCV_1586571 [Trichonephila clavipes]|nr:hypothetical protein TNCV_1586571 [Trichonephila clavipes]